jgi:D-alanyl-D-alanine carboxypeptidase
MLIQRVTGHPWYTEVRSRILRPLRLTRTLTPDVTGTRLPDPHSTTYQQFSPDGPLVDVTLPPRFLETGADGSLIATTGDLGRFLRAPLGSPTRCAARTAGHRPGHARTSRSRMTERGLKPCRA